MNSGEQVLVAAPPCKAAEVMVEGETSLRERLQNPTSTQLPLICSPNLDFLSRDLGPTVRDSVFVTGHFWMCMIFSEIVRG